MRLRREEAKNDIYNTHSRIFKIIGTKCIADDRVPAKTSRLATLFRAQLENIHEMHRSTRHAPAQYCYLAAPENTEIHVIHDRYKGVRRVDTDILRPAIIYRQTSPAHEYMLVCVLIHGKCVPSFIVADTREAAIRVCADYEAIQWPISYESKLSGKYYYWTVPDDYPNNKNITHYPTTYYNNLILAVLGTKADVHWVNTDARGAYIHGCQNISYPPFGNLMIYKYAQLYRTKSAAGLTETLSIALYRTDYNRYSKKYPDAIITATDNPDVYHAMCELACAAYYKATEVPANWQVIPRDNPNKRYPPRMSQNYVADTMYTMPMFVYAISTTPEKYAAIDSADGRPIDAVCKNIGIYVDEEGGDRPYDVVVLRIAESCYLVAPLDKMLSAPQPSRSVTTPRSARRLVLQNFDVVYTTIIVGGGMSYDPSAYEAWRLRPGDKYYIPEWNTPLRPPQYNAIVAIYNLNLGNIPARVGINLGIKSPAWQLAQAAKYILSPTTSTANTKFQYVIVSSYTDSRPQFAVYTLTVGQLPDKPAYNITCV